MKTTEKLASVSSFDGQDIPEIKFGYTFEELEKGDTIPADEVLTPEDILKVVNAKRNASARALKSAKVLADAGHVKKPLNENPLAQFNGMVKILVAAGNTQEQAEVMARNLLPNAPTA